MKKLWIAFAFALPSLLSGVSYAEQAKPVTLADCGNIIGHEMGLWEDFAPTTGPWQVDRALKKGMKFVKISLRRLKDGIWVVNHDPGLAINTDVNHTKYVQLKDLTWQDVLDYQAEPGSIVPIFRLRDYIERDQGRLCWMFSPKDPIDEDFVNQVVQLGIQDRSVILTYGIGEVKYLSTFPASYHLHYAGRVSESEEELAPYGPMLGALWAMEIDPTPRSAAMIQAAHKAGFKAYMDSMRFSWNYELFGTACKKVFAMGADYTQTNRPLQCIRQMHSEMKDPTEPGSR